MKEGLCCQQTKSRDACMLSMERSVQVGLVSAKAPLGTELSSRAVMVLERTTTVRSLCCSACRIRSCRAMSKPPEETGASTGVGDQGNPQPVCPGGARSVQSMTASELLLIGCSLSGSSALVRVTSMG